MSGVRATPLIGEAVFICILRYVAERIFLALGVPNNGGDSISGPVLGPRRFVMFFGVFRNVSSVLRRAHRSHIFGGSNERYTLVSGLN